MWHLDLGGGKVFHTPLAGAEVSRLTWAPGRNRTLRHLDGATVRTYDLSDRLDARWQATPADATALSPDGTVLATATRSGAGYRFELRSTRTGTVLARTPLGSLPTDGDEGSPQLAFSPDGRALAVADTRVLARLPAAALQRLGRPRAPGPYVVRDIRCGGPRRRPRSPSVPAAGRCWPRAPPAATPRPRSGTPPPTAARPPCAASIAGRLGLRPDGRLLAGSADRYAELPSGRVSGRALADGQQVTALAFSPDGTRLAVGDSTGHVHPVGRRPAPPYGHSDRHLRHRLHGRARGRGRARLLSRRRHPGRGRRDGTLRLWDTAGQRLLGSDLPTSGDGIDTLAFTRDGATLYAGGPDVLLQRHPVAPDEVARLLCGRAGGGLTEAQWRTYVPDAPYRQVCPTTR